MPPPPPSATASYDAEYAQSLMEDLDTAPGLLRRALTALLLLALGVYLLGATLSYNPFDTTNDTAGIGVVQNAFGDAGAGFANFMMQLMGWGSIIAGMLCLYAGVRGIFWPRKHTKKFHGLGRFLLGSAVIVFGASALSGFPIPQSWPMASGLGGWVGDGIFLNVKGAFDVFNIPVSGFLASGLLFLLAAFCLARFMGVVGKDFLDVWEAVLLVWATTRVWLDRFVAWVREKFARTYGSDLEKSDSIATLLRSIPDEPAPRSSSITMPDSYTEPVKAPDPIVSTKPKKRRRVSKPLRRVNPPMTTWLCAGHPKIFIE